MHLNLRRQTEVSRWKQWQVDNDYGATLIGNKSWADDFAELFLVRISISLSPPGHG